MLDHDGFNIYNPNVHETQFVFITFPAELRNKINLVI